MHRTKNLQTAPWLQAWKGLKYKCAAKAAKPAPDKLARISALFSACSAQTCELCHAIFNFATFVFQIDNVDTFINMTVTVT